MITDPNRSYLGRMKDEKDVQLCSNFAVDFSDFFIARKSGYFLFILLTRYNFHNTFI